MHVNIIEIIIAIIYNRLTLFNVENNMSSPQSFPAMLNIRDIHIRNTTLVKNIL